MINMSQISVEDKKKKQFTRSDDRPIGHRIRARVDKNSVFMSRGGSCEFDIGYVQGVINQGEEIANLGIKYGLIKRPNKMTYKYEEEKIVGRDSLNEYFINQEKANKLLEVIKTTPLPIALMGDDEEQEDSDNGTN
jgi:hypothetical protein